MAKKEYQKELQGKNIAKAFATNQRISLKYSTELCREVKGQRIDKAEKYLQRIIEKKDFLPLRKYNKKVPHRRGEGKSNVKSGRYPKNVCKAFISLLNSVKANADFKGLDTDNLLIINAFASQGFSRTGHQPKGRIGGKRWKKKSTHLEIVARETTA
ncbi:MAG: 50S ribosomal protein L22 [Candidatus Diapherotrites archaeon]|nr:50S ribosomal protein L22 [Candidatus Diapherotrites archaeon]